MFENRSKEIESKKDEFYFPVYFLSKKQYKQCSIYYKKYFFLMTLYKLK